MAKMRPVTMSSDEDRPPADCAAWSWKVVQRKAPGAMKDIAFTVTPVSVRLLFISTGAISITSLRVADGCSILRSEVAIRVSQAGRAVSGHPEPSHGPRGPRTCRTSLDGNHHHPSVAIGGVWGAFVSRLLRAKEGP